MAGAVEPFMQRKANDGRWMDGWAVWKWPMTAAVGEGRREKEGVGNIHLLHTLTEVEHFDIISAFWATLLPM